MNGNEAMSEPSIQLSRLEMPDEIQAGSQLTPALSADPIYEQIK